MKRTLPLLLIILILSGLGFAPATTTYAQETVTCDPNTDYKALSDEIWRIPYEEAHVIAFCAVQADPTDTEAIFILVDLDYTYGNLESVFLYVPSLLEASPDDYYLMFLMASAYHQTGQRFECYQMAKQAVDKGFQSLPSTYTTGAFVDAVNCSFEVGDLYVTTQIAGVLNFSGVSNLMSDSILSLSFSLFSINPEEALTIAQQVLDNASAMDLGIDYATVALAWALTKNGRTDEGIALINDGVERFQTSFMYAMRAWIYAFIYSTQDLSQANLDNYLADAQTAYDMNPTGYWELFVRAMVGMNDNATARQYGEQLMELYPYNQYAFGQFIRLYSAPEECDKIIGFADIYLSYYPEDETALRYKNDPESCGGVVIEPETSTSDCDPNTDFQATIAELNGDWTQILPVAQCWVESQPDNGEANITLGDAYWYVGEYEKSLDAYQQALTLLPDNTYVLTSIADIYLVMGDYETCLEKANDVLERNPEYTYPLVTVTLCSYGLGDYARVVEVGATWHELIPDSTTALFELADSYRLTGDCANALAIVEEAAVLLPDDTRFADIQAGCNGETSQATTSDCDPNTDFETAIADLYGDWEKYLPMALCWVEAQPDNAAAHITLGDAYWYIGDYSKSLEAYQQALALAPEDVYLLASIGDAYSALADYEACLESANTALEIEPQYGYALEVVMRCAYGQGDYAHVIEIGTTWRELYPDSANSLYQLADSYRLTGDCENALAMVEVAAVLLPDDTRFADVVAGCNGETSQATTADCDPNTDFETAIAELSDWAQILPMAQCWVQSQPDNVSANTRLADAYWSVGEVQKSLEAYQQALALAPEDVYLLTSIADAYVALGDYDACLESINYSLELDPQNIYTLQVATRCSYGAGDYVRAVAIGATLLELYPDDTSALYELADSYRLTGDCENAQAIVDMAVVAFPDDTRFADVVAGCNGETSQAPAFECDPNTDFETAIADLNGDWAQIIPVAQCWVESQPDNLSAYTQLGDAYWYVGDYEKSIEVYEQAVLLAPEDVYLLTVLADTYLYAGDYETCLEKTVPALALDPQNNYTLEVVMRCAHPLGDYARVIEAGTIWHDLYPDATAALFELADSYRLVGDCENAQAIVDAAAVLLPDDTRFDGVEVSCISQTFGVECDPNTDYLALYNEYLQGVSDLPYEEARNILICAIQADPTNSQLTYYLVVLDYEQGNPEGALLYGPMLMEQNPSSSTFTTFVAWGYAVTGQTYECYQLAKKIPNFSFSEIPLPPDLNTAIDKIVVALKCAYEIGDMDLVIQLANLVSHPESDGILAFVLTLYGQDPQYVLELAQSAYDKANEQNLESPYPTVGLAFALFSNGRADEAIALMTEGVERFPTSYMYAMRAQLYAIIYYNLDPVDAYLDNYFADVQTALEIDPTSPWGLIMAGMTGVNDSDTVVSYGEQVMALYPYIRWAFGATVTSYAVPEECEAMLRYIDAYLVYYPDDELALYYRNDPEWCGGVTIETTSAECDPNTDFETTIANLNGDWAQVIPVAQCWVDSQPDNPSAYIQLGDAYWYSGDYETALSIYQQGATQFPTNTYLRTATADTYWGLGNPEACLENVTVALEVDPQYYYAQEIAMHCLYDLGDYARVIEIGAVWHELYPDATSGLLNLADSYRLTGDCDNALAIVEVATVLIPDETRFADIQTACGG